MTQRGGGGQMSYMHCMLQNDMFLFNVPDTHQHSVDKAGAHVSAGGSC